MAILFSCPYCTASVKVPDSASGKLGACPKCGTKVRIPNVPIPPPSMNVAPPPVSPVALPGAAPQVRGLDLDFLDPQAAIPPVAPPPRPPVLTDPFDFSAAAAAAPAYASSVARKKATAPRKPMGSGPLIVVGLALLALAGAGIWTYVQNLPVYEGTVAGMRVPSGQAIAVTVPWSSIEVPPQTQLPVIEYFKKRKTSLTNNLLKIDIGASAQGLIVRFETTAESMLVSVDPQLVPDIKTLITQNKAAWDESRKRELIQSAQELCAIAAKAQAAGTRMENVSGYRDSVALNALVRGLGRHCVAVANKVNHPCVFEDELGQLFFVVHHQATDLLIVEKSGEGRVKVLPVDFRIYARVPSTASATPQIVTPPPEEEAEAAPNNKKEKPEMPAAEGEADAAESGMEMQPESVGDEKMMMPVMKKMMTE